MLVSFEFHSFLETAHDRLKTVLKVSAKKIRILGVLVESNKKRNQFDLNISMIMENYSFRRWLHLHSNAATLQVLDNQQILED